MNKKLIREFGEEVLCYRLRTKRHKIRMQYKDFDKQLRQLNREETKLRQQRNKLGWQPLLPPVQRGWKRTFVLREDLDRTANAAFFNNILQKINTVDRSWRKDFKKKKRYMGRKIYAVKPQYLKKLDLWEWKKADFTAKEQQFFQCILIIDKKGYVKQQHEFLQPWRFVLKVLPDMIDKVRIKDAVLEQRLQEIRNCITRNGYNGRIYKIVYGGNKWRGNSKPGAEKNGFDSKPLGQVLYEVNEEKY
jgi:hypothetical protein